jgi:hypothetical protein
LRGKKNTEAAEQRLLKIFHKIGFDWLEKDKQSMKFLYG